MVSPVNPYGTFKFCNPMTPNNLIFLRGLILWKPLIQRELYLWITFKNIIVYCDFFIDIMLTYQSTFSKVSILIL
jgi:hypothetical protein